LPTVTLPTATSVIVEMVTVSAQGVSLGKAQGPTFGVSRCVSW
jgi:hypothetical protein